MNKITAKFTQLPNFEHEYIEILNRFKDGMSEREIEDMVSQVKGSVLASRYKHRTHLYNLGFFTKDDFGNMQLSYTIKQVKEKKCPLSDALLELVLNNEELLTLFKQIDSFAYFEGKCSRTQLAKELNAEYYCDSPPKTIERYLGQILKLFFIIGPDQIKRKLDKSDVFIDGYNLFTQGIIKLMNESFPNQYRKTMPIEQINNYLLDLNLSKDEIAEYWNNLFHDKKFKYIFTFITLPNWATKSKGLRIGKNYFTHLIFES